MSIVAGFMVPHPPLIIPNIGKGREKDIEKTINSYEEIGKEISKINPDTIIISSPHAPLYYDSFYISDAKELTGSFENFNASEVNFNEIVDKELVDEIKIQAKINNINTTTNNSKLDHGTMIPLYFIRKYLSNYKIVVVGISELSFSEHYKFGEIINKAVSNLDRKVVFVASGDLSHRLQTYGPYGFCEEGPIYDKEIMKIMSNASFLELLRFKYQLYIKARVCGHLSFLIMAGAFDKTSLISKMYSHEDITGVGYGICSYYAKDINPNRNFREIYLKELEDKLKDKENDLYIKLAKETIDNYIKDKSVHISDEYNKLMDKRGGVFVCIHRENILRGCIGTIIPTKKTIIEEIVENAISAATKDNRFNKIEEWELPYLDIQVDELKDIEDISSKNELDVKRYGVIVSSGYKRGVLLPNIDGVDTVDEQIEIAKRKAGISINEEYKLQRFEVIRHE